jgi:hypothetical protein
MRRGRKGQSAPEYAFLLAAVVAGLLASQFYVKRSVQGRLHQIGDGLGFTYAPQATTSDLTVSLTRTQVDTFTTAIEPDPEDPTRELTTTTILSEVLNDETTTQGDETVEERPDAGLFD